MGRTPGHSWIEHSPLPALIVRHPGQMPGKRMGKLRPQAYPARIGFGPSLPRQPGQIAFRRKAACGMPPAPVRRERAWVISLPTWLKYGLAPCWTARVRA